MGVPGPPLRRHARRAPGAAGDADGADGAEGDATVERLAGAPAWSKLMEVGYGGMAVAKSIDINSITLR